MRNGFTLLEVLVALIIAAATVAIGFGAVAVLSDRSDLASDYLRSESRALATRAQLMDWLAGARLLADRTGPAFQAHDDAQDGLANDRVSLLTTGASPFGFQESEVRLFIDRDPETAEKGLVAEILEWRGNGRRMLELERDVAGLSLRFLSRVTGEERWFPSWVSSTVLPAAVELTLQPEAGRALHPLVAFPMRVPIGAGQ